MRFIRNIYYRFFVKKKGNLNTAEDIEVFLSKALGIDCYSFAEAELHSIMCGNIFKMFTIDKPNHNIRPKIELNLNNKPSLTCAIKSLLKDDYEVVDKASEVDCYKFRRIQKKEQILIQNAVCKQYEREIKRYAN